MASLLTQLRNQKARYRTESTTGNRFLQAYNTYLTEQYQPAYTKAYQYKPVVDSAYKQYRSAFDKAKGEYNQILSQRKSEYQNVLSKGDRLYKSYESASTSLSNYKTKNLDPYESEYNTRLNAYQTAKTKAEQSWTKNYTDTQKALGQAYTNTFNSAVNQYETQANALSKDYETKYNKAKEMESEVVNKYKNNMWVQKNTVFNPYTNIVQKFDQAKYLGGNQFEYKIGGQTYNIKQAPDYFDVSYGFLVEKRVKDYNFYSKTYASGDAQQYGIPSYVDDKWLEQEYKNIENLLDPTSGLLKTFQTTGETRRAEYATAFDSVNTYISSTLNPAETKYKDFVATSKQDYADQKSATALKNYNDFTAVSVADYIKPYVDKSTKTQYEYAKQYESIVSKKQQAYQQYKQTYYDPAYTAYTNFANSSEVSNAKSNYENIVNDTGYVDRKIGPQKTQYETTKAEFDRLKAVYESMQPTLSQLESSYEESMNALGSMRSDIARLEKSVQIDLDPRKAATRIGQRQSILTKGSKRAGAAR